MKFAEPKNIPKDAFEPQDPEKTKLFLCGINWAVLRMESKEKFYLKGNKNFIGYVCFCTEEGKENNLDYKFCKLKRKSLKNALKEMKNGCDFVFFHLGDSKGSSSRTIGNPRDLKHEELETRVFGILEDILQNELE